MAVAPNIDHCGSMGFPSLHARIVPRLTIPPNVANAANLALPPAASANPKEILKIAPKYPAALGVVAMGDNEAIQIFFWA